MEQTEPILNNSPEKLLLKGYFNEITLLYKVSKEERTSIHNEEFCSDWNYSILGEVELLSDHLAGIMSSFDKYTISDLNTKTLKDARDRSRQIIALWLEKNREKYPNFSKYIELVDYLVLLLLQYNS